VLSRPIRPVVVSALAALALVGVASCSSGEPAAPPPGQDAPPISAAPAQPAQPGAAGDAQNPAGPQGGALGTAVQGAAGLAALGGLGQAQGAGDQVRGLGAQLEAEGQALSDQLRQAATAQGATLDEQPTAEQQAILADLQARSGEPFDQAWLRAAMQAQQQAREAAEAVLASPDASEEAKAAARDALARLDTLTAGLQQAGSSAGAGTPGAVNAGSGGQAAQDLAPVVALGLLGAGSALLGGAAWRRRRTA
jgi:predicted outer membrane protein